MSTDTTAAPAEVDALEYVRERLAGMPAADRASLAGDTKVSLSTVYNIMRGHDTKYSTVMTLRKALRELEAAAAQ